MPFDPQTSELTNRIRRGFGQRGALGIHVDEVAVPTVQIYDLDKAPFRTIQQRFFDARDLAPGAGNVGRYVVDAPAGGSAVIDQVCIYNNTGAANRFFISTSTGTSGATACVSPELDVGGLEGTPVLGTASTPVAAAPFGNVLYLLGLGGTTQLVLDCEIVLQPGMEMTLQSEVAAAAVRFSISGRFYLPV